MNNPNAVSGFDKVCDTFGEQGIEVEHFLNENREVKMIEDGYLAFLKNAPHEPICPLYLTSELKLLDISNVYFSAERIHYQQDFQKYDLIKKRILEVKNKIASKKYISINEDSVGSISFYPLLHVHNLESQLINLENIQDNESIDKKTNLTFVTLNVDNLFYKNLEQQLKILYRDLHLNHLSVELDNIYFFKKIFVSKSHPVINLKSKQYILNNFYNRLLLNMKESGDENRACREKVIFVKTKDLRNGTNHDNRCYKMDQVDSVLQKYEIRNLSKVDLDLKDIYVMKCEFGIFSWGSNMYYNSNILNFASGKKFIIFVTSGYEAEDQKKADKAIWSSDNTHMYLDNIYRGNFVRFVYRAKDDELTNDLLDSVMKEFQKNYRFEKLYTLLAEVKQKFSYQFLSKCPYYQKYESGFRINLFWKHIGYEIIEYINNISGFDVDSFMDKNEYNSEIHIQNTAHHLFMFKMIHQYKDFPQHLVDLSFYVPSDFDTAFYSSANPDCSFMDAKQLCLHYFMHGYQEKRVCKINVPPDFDVGTYKSLNKDLQSLSDFRATCHYMIFGIRESRKYKLDDNQNTDDP